MSTLELTHTQEEGKGAIALDRFRDHMYDSIGFLTSQWSNIYFAHNARGRLMSIVGWLVGLAQSGREEEAKKYALDLCDMFDYLNTYGGTETQEDDGFVPLQELAKPIEVPSYRVVLEDDGTFHGFSVGWYRRIPVEKIIDSYGFISRRRALAIGSSVTEWESSRAHVEQGMADARAEWKTNQRVRITRYALLKCDADLVSVPYRNSIVDVNYGFCMNGGLLYYGPGKGETFSVRIGNSENVWSIHT